MKDKLSNLTRCRSIRAVDSSFPGHDHRYGHKQGFFLSVTFWNQKALVSCLVELATDAESRQYGWAFTP